jgi:Ca2+-binding EF-hand superfamily protein
MIENIRQRAKQNILLPHREIFNSLDWMGRGFLTCQEIRKFFSSFPHSGISVCPEAIEKQIEIEALIRRFNKDKLSGKISLPEFLDELTPKEEEKRY